MEEWGKSIRSRIMWVGKGMMGREKMSGRRRDRKEVWGVLEEFEELVVEMCGNDEGVVLDGVVGIKRKLVGVCGVCWLNV